MYVPHNGIVLRPPAWFFVFNCVVGVGENRPPVLRLKQILRAVGEVRESALFSSEYLI